MKFQLGILTNALGLALAIGMAGCGGGGGGGGTPTGSNPPVVTTTDVSTTVIDGAIKNAVVCMDKNGNGLCDTGEPSGVTDATGKVTIAVPNADVGKYPLLAMVGTNAVDVDNGTITVAYTMSAPAANAALISPLTHLVQETVASTGVTAAEAERAMQSTTGITASLFQDFSTVTAPTDGSPSAKTVARMVVVATQAQVVALAPALGTTAIDSAT